MSQTPDVAMLKAGEIHTFTVPPSIVTLINMAKDDRHALVLVVNGPEGEKVSLSPTEIKSVQGEIREVHNDGPATVRASW